MKWGEICKARVILVLLIIFISNLGYCAENSAEVTESASNLLEWIVSSKNNNKLPFIIIDKKEAKVFAFSPNGKLYSSAPALMGTAIGDDSSVGIGRKKLANIKVSERTTPAGRFKAQLGLNLDRTEILWIDYDLAVSMHPVITTNPSEHRMQRLAGNSISDKRITYGCVNVPKDFFKNIIRPLFKKSNGIVYILPEVHSIKAVFGAEADQFTHRE